MQLDFLTGMVGGALPEVPSGARAGAPRSRRAGGDRREGEPFPARILLALEVCSTHSSHQPRGSSGPCPTSAAPAGSLPGGEPRLFPGRPRFSVAGSPQDPPPPPPYPPRARSPPAHGAVSPASTRRGLRLLRRPLLSAGVNSRGSAAFPVSRSGSLHHSLAPPLKQRFFSSR